MKQLLQTKCRASLNLFLFYGVTVLAACNGTGYSNPAGYDLRKPTEAELGKVLNEISGLSWDERNDALVAIADNKEKIFQIGLKNKKIKDLSDKAIPPDSDTEDIVYTDSAFYLLSSWGEIRKVPMGAKDSTAINRYSLGLEGQNDFETMYYDSAAKGLIIICKSCAHEKGLKIRTAYRFNLQTTLFDSVPFFTISREAVEEKIKDPDASFDPSGGAIHPLTGEVFILSSSGNLLVITSKKGEIIDVFKLNPDKFPQAEGIAFAPNGDMYISNEGKYGKPTLLFFPYQLKGSKNKKANTKNRKA
ncbi:MAG: SdiA-regulated domain-containing protein [Bacteroidota bacterium]